MFVQSLPFIPMFAFALAWAIGNALTSGEA